ncbi:hypothetical protein BS78_08G135100 [Paspalum vaginatum]|nr:hypothetical protein BS78_08G135100 [Paspalum vaginatum]
MAGSPISSGLSPWTTSLISALLVVTLSARRWRRRSALCSLRHAGRWRRRDVGSIVELRRPMQRGRRWSSRTPRAEADGEGRMEAGWGWSETDAARRPMAEGMEMESPDGGYLAKEIGILCWASELGWTG